jgi:transposase
MGQEKMSNRIAPTPDQTTIGIGISKDHLDVRLHPAGCVQQFTNDRKGHTKLIAWAKPKHPTRIIFEATGAYHRALEMALGDRAREGGQAGLPGIKINPLQARRFAEATGKRVKTDPVDAAMLARFGATMQPDIPPARDQIIDGLAELLAARRALVKDRTATLNRAKALTLVLLKRQSQQHLTQIKSQIEAIDQQRADILATHPALKARFDILVSMPGLGSATALAMLIDMPELGSMDAKQAASLAGLAPVTRQSGNWRGKSFIQGGRAVLRQALYMPAVVAIRCNPPLKAKYLALRHAGKPAKVAIVAIMRKIVITANALLRDNRMWTAQVA